MHAVIFGVLVVHGVAGGAGRGVGGGCILGAGKCCECVLGVPVVHAWAGGEGGMLLVNAYWWVSIGW